MRYLYFKDCNLRKKYNLLEKNLILAKSLIYLKIISYNNNLNDYYKVVSFCLKKHKKFSSVKIKNRCILTYNGRWVSRRFFLGRSKLRLFFSFGLIFGWRRSIW